MAPVLGIAKNGPMVKIKTVLKIRLKIGETLSEKLSSSLPAKPDAIIPNKGKPIPVIQNPRAANFQLSPTAYPTDGGKIRFPAPNNMANNANPVNIMSFVL